MGIFAGIRCFRYVTPSVVLFIIGYFSPNPLVSQYVYTRTLHRLALAANVTLTKGHRLIPCSNDTNSSQYTVQMEVSEKGLRGYWLIPCSNDTNSSQYTVQMEVSEKG